MNNKKLAPVQLARLCAEKDSEPLSSLKGINVQSRLSSCAP
jgi:hypothetical protein